MKKKIAHRVGLLLSASLLAQAAWSGVPLGSVPYYPGEDLLFKLRWGAIVGGYSTLEIAGVETVNGREALHLVSKARTTGLVDTLYQVRDRNDAWFDPATGSSLRYEKKIREGKYHVDQQVTLDQDRHVYQNRHYRIDKDRFEETQGEIPPNVLDVFGSLYYVRGLPLEDGRAYTLDVHSGKKVWPLTVRVLRRETKKVHAGRFRCVVVEPELRGEGLFVTKGKKLQVWLTDDERRLPIFMRTEVVIGHVTAELIRYQTGSERAEKKKVEIDLPQG